MVCLGFCMKEYVSGGNFMNTSAIRSDKQIAIIKLKETLKKDIVILDTETTGLGNDDEIVEISIIDKNENILLDTLVKPTISISYDAYNTHGIFDLDVMDAPRYPEIHKEIIDIIKDKIVVIYNASYDFRILEQTSLIYNLENPLKHAKDIFCAMKNYSVIYGEWKDYYNDYKWCNLSKAAHYEDVDLEGMELHRALGDTIITLRLMKKIENNYDDI